MLDVGASKYGEGESDMSTLNIGVTPGNSVKSSPGSVNSCGMGPLAVSRPLVCVACFGRGGRAVPHGFCEEPLCVRRFLAGGAELCPLDGAACAIRCSLSHWKVHAFRVFSQLPHGAKQPNESAKSANDSSARLHEAYRCNERAQGPPMRCLDQAKCLREWRHRTPVCPCGTGRSTGSASGSSWMVWGRAAARVSGRSTHSRGRTAAGRRRNS